MRGITRKLVLACLLTFITTSLSILVQTYSSMVFLSSYSASKIPYLFLISGIAAFIFSQLLKVAISRNLYGYTMHLHWVFIAILIPYIWILSLPIFWMPFVFAVLLLTMYGFSATVFGTIENCPFNLREFKAVGYWLSAFGALGGLTAGASVPIILHIWPPTSLLVIIILAYCVAMILVRLLRDPVVISQSRVVPDTVTSHLFRHPLVISVFGVFILSVMIATFADYSLKSLLAKFGQAEIGDILAPFYAITNIVAMLVQLFISPKIIKKYGVSGLLYSYPFAVLIGSIILLVYPELSTTLLFGMMVFSTHYAFFYTGKQMITNVLPDSIRTITGYQLQSIGKNTAVGIAALMLIPIGMGGIRAAAISLILGSFILIYYLRSLNREYNEGLKESINFHRFNLDYLSATETDVQMLSEQAEIALQSNEPDVQLFGFELLKHARLKEVPEVLYQALSSHSILVQRNALRMIAKIGDHHALPLLKERLDSETRPRIVWNIVRAILKLNVTLLLPFAREHQDSQEPYLQCANICIFLEGGNIDELLFALENFKKMVRDPHANTRSVACEVLQHIHVGDLSNDLILLLNDKNEKVVLKALKVARYYGSQSVISVILKKTSSKRLFHAISKTLVYIGPVVIPQLVSEINHPKAGTLIPKEINLLSSIPGEFADLELIRLLDHPDRRFQDISARHLAYRAIRFTDHNIKKNLLLQKIQEEVQFIQGLMKLRDQETHDGIQAEIKSRIWFSQKKYLHLLIAYSGNEFLLELSPTLLYGEKSTLIYFKSIELLDMGIQDKTVASTIEFALEGKIQDQEAAISDPWLTQLMAFKLGQLTEKNTMDMINKVLVLRKVALFKHLTAESLQHIAETLTVVDLPAGHTVFHKGDFANGLYIVAKGEIDIANADQHFKTCREADFFGELALLDNEPRSATATTTTNSLLYLLAKEDFNRITDDIPEILKVIVQTLMAYLRPYLSHH